jgi:3-phenylpropionate/trans-cinnamate dioxygenase ferredoxin subunit
MFQRAAALDDVPEGKVRYIELAGEPIALCNAGGTIYAISSICTHDGGPLDQGEIEGETIVCPRHGARFDIRTGRVLRPPATRKLRTYPVEIRDGAIYVDPHP